MFKQSMTYYDINNEPVVISNRFDAINHTQKCGRLSMLILNTNINVHTNMIFLASIVLSQDVAMRGMSGFSILKNKLGSHGHVKYPRMVFEENYDAMCTISVPGAILISEHVRDREAIIEDLLKLYAFRRYYLLI